MYSIGEKVFYGVHGVCIIEDIQEQNFTGKKTPYYTLRSYQNESMQLYHPVECENSKIEPVISAETAAEILEVFKDPASEWQDRPTSRNYQYREAINSSDHFEIAQMLNTMLRKKYELAHADKKMPSQDAQNLLKVSPILYAELALSLGTTSERIAKKIEEHILQNP